MDGFEGTVLSGGTTEGISGLVGELGHDRGEAVTTVGYLPEFLPADATVDHRYDELRRTDGHGFSPAEPLQNWVDLVASGIRPDTVRVLGINGGRIAAVEYRIALALGATVGLVADSGREAGRLLSEERWSGQRGGAAPAGSRGAARVSSAPSRRRWTSPSANSSGVPSTRPIARSASETVDMPTPPCPRGRSCPPICTRRTCSKPTTSSTS